MEKLGTLGEVLPVSGLCDAGIPCHGVPTPAVEVTENVPSSPEQLLLQSLQMTGKSLHELLYSISCLAGNPAQVQSPVLWEVTV